MHMKIYILLLTCIVVYACGKSSAPMGEDATDEVPTPEEEAVTFTFDALERVGYFDAGLKFTVVAGNKNIRSRGVVYSTKESPTKSDEMSLAVSTTGSGSFEVGLDKLLEGKTYYVRPFAEKTSGTIFYGDQVTFETVSYPKPTVYLDSLTFLSQQTFETYWKMFYPWGTDHNGSARMYEDQVSLDGAGVLKIRADRTEVWEGYSTADPWLRIFYHSGAIHAKQQILVNDEKPYWVVSGDFQVPTMVGSWPAFWISGAWTWPPEIDIMEFKGNNTNWQNTVTGPNWQNTSWQTTKTVVENAGSWHNYKLIMYKTSATHVAAELYIDGQKKATHTGDFIGKPFWLIINMQMEGASGGHASGPQSTEMQARNIYLAAYDVIP